MTAVDLKPSDSFSKAGHAAEVLLLACGALAREIVDLVDSNGWKLFDIQCLPAKWHNTPQFIVPALRDKIRANKALYKRIYVVYGDCGTGGQLDAMLKEEGVERIEGPHCYAFYSGNKAFAAREDTEFTCFFLTDYLARHFEKLMWEGLGLDRHPELLKDYFGNYTKLIYLAQTDDKGLQARAEDAARRLGLAYEYRFTGYGELATEMQRLA
ncbi:DUF1638 domain-containing protein [Aestuariivirga litoralis]|uniref:DUF1638 domain-containing protein n=1 Tax=Aestuariivirga litoralis TaxID=2650924 RepID=UPI0018C4D1CA|nr:DUF1638 domain-containing protein [Aestuariivirga litoralis]MBG1231988.1 DUF1638 domain-containing protein [Aestuariivirga litoralis]